MRTNENTATKNNTSKCKDSRETKGDTVALSKKDYIAIADIFHQYMTITHSCNDAKGDVTIGAMQDEPNSFHILNDLMQYMKQDNPRFNKAKFLEKVAAPHG